MVYRMIIHLNIELQIPVIYRADFGLRGFTPFLYQQFLVLKIYWENLKNSVITGCLPVYM